MDKKKKPLSFASIDKLTQHEVAGDFIVSLVFGWENNLMGNN